MKTALALAAALLFTLGAGCALDCEGQCENDYRDCLEDPGMTGVQCDVGLDQCLASCGAGASGAPDGG